MERSMELTLPANWDDIERARNQSSSFFSCHNLHNDSIEALTMIVSELIENSIKYGSFSNQNDKIILSISFYGSDITIEVVNPIDEKVYTHLRRLDKTIQWIRGYQDSFEAYVNKMEEISKRPLNDEESGLGLVRIAYEGKAIIDFYVSEENLLNVSAISDFHTY